ncbi:MAG TPA: hypothetical protein VJZ03_03035 [Candidatus Bathyarchaeia archaeon]|nr:hypothetical protein [Candidatus Bathyarchaeia archaeon]
MDSTGKRDYRRYAKSILLLSVITLVTYWIYYSYYSPQPTFSTSTFRIPLSDSDFSFGEAYRCWSNTTGVPNPVLYIVLLNRFNESVHFINNSITYDTFSFSNGSTLNPDKTNTNTTVDFASYSAFRINFHISNLANGIRLTAAKIEVAVFVLELDKTVRRTYIVNFQATDPPCTEA